jgi:hypothetical protein
MRLGRIGSGLRTPIPALQQTLGWSTRDCASSDLGGEDRGASSAPPVVPTGERPSPPQPGSAAAEVHPLLGSGAHVSRRGKGRKDRITPLVTGTVATLRTWLAERQVTPPTRSFQPATAGHSAATRWNATSPHTQSWLHGAARHYSQADLGPRPVMHGCHATTPRRRRRLGHRPLARPRARGDHPGLPARRPQPQEVGPRPHQVNGGQDGSFRPGDALLTSLEV